MPRQHMGELVGRTCKEGFAIVVATAIVAITRCSRGRSMDSAKSKGNRGGVLQTPAQILRNRFRCNMPENKLCGNRSKSPRGMPSPMIRASRRRRTERSGGAERRPRNEPGADGLLFCHCEVGVGRCGRIGGVGRSFCFCAHRAA